MKNDMFNYCIIHAQSRSIGKKNDPDLLATHSRKIASGFAELKEHWFLVSNL
jgi:hypothetical protein